ncbi:MAG TPA: hypothetical protein VGO34_11285 [Alphaproteobacteria bacterium]|jgi:hypothetical protein
MSAVALHDDNRRLPLFNEGRQNAAFLKITFSSQAPKASGFQAKRGYLRLEERPSGGNSHVGPGFFETDAIRVTPVSNVNYEARKIEDTMAKDKRNSAPLREWLPVPVLLVALIGLVGWIGNGMSDDLKKLTIDVNANHLEMVRAVGDIQREVAVINQKIAPGVQLPAPQLPVAPH